MTDTDLDTDSGADTAARQVPPPRRQGRLVVIALGVVLAVVAAVVFWATRPDDSASPRSTTTTAAPSTTASDEEPPGTDPAAVEPYIATLLATYDEVTSQILADPAIAGDPEHPLYTELRALLAPDSEMTDPVIRALDRRGRQGISQEPLDEGKLPVRRAVEGDIETVSADEVTFSTCTRYDYRLVNSEGAPVEVGIGESEPGSGVAVRVEGHWVLSRLEMSGQLVRCKEAE